MNVDDAVRILSERKREQECSCIQMPMENQCLRCEESTLVAANYEAMTHSELLQGFLSLQQLRVKTYASFSSTLQYLLSENRVGEYPSLCAEVTARFAALGTHFLSLIVATESVSTDSSQVMRQVQLLEKEKLLLVAAQHLDMIRDHCPAMKLETDGITLNTSNRGVMYLKEQIEQFESRISSLVEELQAILAEL